MNYYKVIILEKSYYTAYIKAKNEFEAEERVYNECIHTIDNQNFDQKVIEIEQIEEENLPIGITINN